MDFDDFFLSALIPWFRNRGNDVAREIAHVSGIDINTMFRPDVVDDATLRVNVPAAGQRLLRWSYAGPEEIFVTGFQPRVFPQTGDFTPQEAFNLNTYGVATNHASVFVSTTRPYRNEGGTLVRWARDPRYSQEEYHRFEYEIFAYGGIDVNRAIGAHPYDSQQEIAFPGGISPSFIRSAREYVDGRIIRVWENTNFNNFDNEEHGAPLAGFPTLHGHGRTPRDAVVLACPPFDPNPPYPLHPNPNDGDLRRRRSVTDTLLADTDDLMFGDGTGVPDQMYDVVPAPLNSVSCALHNTKYGKAWFFCGNRYVTVDLRNTDKLAIGPGFIGRNWRSLSQAKFAGGVDAILPAPYNPTKQMYFFCADEYALIDVTGSDCIVNGPKKIANEWPSLQNAGFDYVDAVLPVGPTEDGTVYFFCGEQYAYIKIAQGSTDDYIIDGPHNIKDKWWALKQVDFATVDAVLRNPYETSVAYFFSGQRYVQLTLHSPSGATIFEGPGDISELFPGLHKEAMFY